MGYDQINHISCAECRQPFEPTWTSKDKCGNCLEKSNNKMKPSKTEILAIIDYLTKELTVRQKWIKEWVPSEGKDNLDEWKYEIKGITKRVELWVDEL